MVNKVKKKLPVVSIQKWPLTAAIVIILLCASVLCVSTPLTVSIIKKTISLYRNNKMISCVKNYDEESRKLNADNIKLDSMLIIYREKHEHQKSNLVESLYTYADKAGIKTSKVEIGEPVRIDNHTENAINIKGQGSFAAIGKFTESIENADQSLRIRLLDINAEKDDLLNMTMDFVIVE